MNLLWENGLQHTLTDTCYLMITFWTSSVTKEINKVCDRDTDEKYIIN